MSLSDKDKQIWQEFTWSVQPLKADRHVPVTCVPIKVPITHDHMPRHTLDLHGMTLAQAYDAVSNMVQQGVHNYSYVTVITGKSGVMQGELPDWVGRMQGIRMCEPINGGGAFRISFKKTRHKHK